MSALRVLLSAIRGRVHTSVRCDRCEQTRPTIAWHEYELLRAHRYLLCPCGGNEWPVLMVGPES